MFSPAEEKFLFLYIHRITQRPPNQAASLLFYSSFFEFHTTDKVQKLEKTRKNCKFFPFRYTSRHTQTTRCRYVRYSVAISPLHCLLSTSSLVYCAMRRFDLPWQPHRRSSVKTAKVTFQRTKTMATVPSVKLFIIATQP